MSKDGAENGLRKAAILLIGMGDEASTQLLRALSEDEAHLLSREIAKVEAITTDESTAVMEEFERIMNARNYLLQGGIEYAKKILINAYGLETGKKLLSQIVKAMGNESASFDALQKADPQQLGRFLHNESPQTMALILSRLIPSQAAAVLASLPANLRAETAKRMATLDQISPDIIKKIATVVGRKLKDVGEVDLQSYGGVRAVAEMLNRLETSLSEEVMAQISKDDPTLADTIRRLMFVFDDLLGIDQQGIKMLLAKVDRKVLTIALKGTAGELKEHFMKCLSERAAEMLREDMAALGPIKIREVEAAQQQIIAVARQMQAEGSLNMKGASEEQYVS